MNGVGKWLIGVALCIALFAAAQIPGMAAMYYVSPSGSDSNSGRSPDTAWATINKGDRENILAPGDTVIVEAGTYDMSGPERTLSVARGTADNPITYRANGAVILDRGANAGSVLTIIGPARHIVLDGFHLTGGSTLLFMSDTSGNEIKKCWLSDRTGGDDNPALWLVACGDNNIHHNVIGPNLPAYTCGIVDDDSRGNNKFCNNTIVDTTDWAFFSGGDAPGVEFRNNIVYSADNGVLDANPSMVHSHNIFHGVSGILYDVSAADLTEVTDDPGFADPADGDYHLLTSSPAIDSGMTVGFGYNGSAPDVGAFETAGPSAIVHAATPDTETDETEDDSVSSPDDSDSSSILSASGESVGVLAVTGDDLILHYNFDEGSGTTVYDQSSSGINGTITGNAKWVATDRGYGLYFDGGTYVNCGTSSTFGSNDQGTIETWVYLKYLQGGILSRHTGTSWENERLLFAFDTYGQYMNQICVNFGNGTSSSTNRWSTLAPLNEWAHLVVTFDSSTVKLYINGSLVQSKTKTVAPSVSNVGLWIGRCEGMGYEYLIGVMDDIKLYDAPFDATEVKAGYTTGAIEHRVDNSLVLHYDFSEGTGSTVYDKSGRGTNGTINGTVTWSDTDHGKALYFNGTNTYIDCGSSSTFGSTNEGTIETWCNIDDIQGGIVNRSNGTAWTNERLVWAFNTYGSNNKLVWSFSDGSSYNYSNLNTPALLDQWTHLVMKFDSSTVKVYMNGAMVESFNRNGIAPSISGISMRIGWCEGFGTAYLKGYMDELKLYNRPLTDQEIEDSYVWGAKDRGIDPSLVLHYKFTEGSGSTVYDKSGRGINGTINGTVTWSDTAQGKALYFNGTSTYIDCGTSSTFGSNDEGTIETWVYPEARQGGIVTRSNGTAWTSERLVWAFNTYGGNDDLAWSISDGSSYNSGTLSPDPTLDQWTHFVLTYDSSSVKIYKDGSLAQSYNKTVAPSISGLGLKIGWCEGFGTAYFKGYMNELKLYNRALPADEILSHYGLVLHYTFGDGNVTAYTSTVHDKSPCNTDGALTGASFVYVEDGSRVMDFNGSSSYIDCGTSSPFGTTSSGTIAMWCNLDAYKGGLVTRSNGSLWTNERLVLSFNDYNPNDKRFQWSTSNGTSYDYGNIGTSYWPALGKWAHVVETYDSSTAKIYVNGSLVQSFTRNVAPSVSGVNLRIGWCQGFGSTYLDGKVKEVKLYNRALSKAEIEQESVGTITRLNNLVVELLKFNTLDTVSSQEFTFENPRKGWVFFSTDVTITNSQTDKVWLTLDGKPQSTAIIKFDGDTTGVKEAMQFLSEGKHTLKIQTSGSPSFNNVVARAIPELIYNRYANNPEITGFGNYNWTFLSNNKILDSLNCLNVGGISDLDADSNLRSWHNQGKRIVTESYKTDGDCYSIWAAERGYKDFVGDGITVDEFTLTPSDTKYDSTGGDGVDWAGDIDELYANHPKWSYKVYYPFSMQPLWTANPGLTFATSTAKCSGALFQEWYYAEQPSTADEDTLFANIKNDISSWKSSRPGGQRHYILNLAYQSAPSEFFDNYPDVNYKVYLDGYMKHIATDTSAEFKDVYGLAWYTCKLTDEEIMRWGSRLFRHYAIEGNTSSLADTYGYSHSLSHISNPEFVSGTANWTEYEAGTNTITTGSDLHEWGFLQGRYPYNHTLGSTYAKTKRCSNQPNRIEQTISGLTVGKAYSVTMLASDYIHIRDGDDAGTSADDPGTEDKELDVALYVTGANVISTLKEENVQSNYSHHDSGDLIDRNFGSNRPAYMNYFRIVFEATSTTATVGIRDWESAGSRVGPVDQEIIYNYVQVQPYYEGTGSGY